MEADYKKAFDFVTNTGQGLMDEGKDITEYVKKLCPYYYELDPIKASRASTKPLSMFESEGDIIDVDSEKSDNNNYNNDDDEDYNPIDNDPQMPEAKKMLRRMTWVMKQSSRGRRRGPFRYGNCKVKRKQLRCTPLFSY